LILALGYTGAFAMLYLWTPDLFLLGHQHGMEAETFARLRDLTIVLLRFVAAYCILDAFSLVFANALKGAGDTTFVMAATLIAGCIAVAVAWVGLERFGFDLVACWFVITGLICVMGTTFLLRFLQGAWQEMRVIEPELLEK
jgi:MATE family multidrug resistance protein